MKIIFCILFLLFAETCAEAYDVKATRELFNDFPNDHYMVMADKSSPDFNFYAYFKYMSAGMCKKALPWLESIKQKNTDYYSAAKGIAYGNGDCLPEDFDKSHTLLLSCFDKLSICDNSLIDLYARHDIVNKHTYSLAVNLALKGSLSGIFYILSIYENPKSIQDVAKSLFWLYIANNLFGNDPGLALEIKKSISVAEKSISKANASSILHLSDKITQQIRNKSSEFQKSSDSFQINHIYGLMPVAKKRIQGSMNTRQIKAIDKKLAESDSLITEMYLSSMQTIESLR